MFARSEGRFYSGWGTPTTSLELTKVALSLAAAWGVSFVLRRAGRYLAKLSSVGRNPWKALFILLRQPFVFPLLIEASEKMENEETSKTRKTATITRTAATKPQQSTCSHALLVIFPDDQAPPDAYVELARLIQQKALLQHVSLHVGIAKLQNSRLSSLWWRQTATHANIAVLQRRVQRQRSVQLDHVFLYGHGSSTETFLDTAPYTAVIRFGSLPSPVTSCLYDYPKPCLTLLGDCDRQVPYLQLASLLDNWEKGTAHDSLETVPIPKPILLLPGLNHVCLVNPQNAQVYLHQQNDLPFPNMSRETALDQVACVTANFVRIILEKRAQEWNELAKLTAYTQRRLQTYRSLLTRRAQADFVTRLQQHIYGTDSKIPYPVSVHFSSDLLNFVYAKPQIGSDFVRAFLYEQNKPLQIHGQTVLSSPTWAIKCKSRKALQSTFDPDNTAEIFDHFDHWTHTFQEFNHQTFDHVLLHVVTPEERSRFVTAGLRLEFDPDQNFMKRSSLQWIFADLVVAENPANDSIVVSTPAGYTTCTTELALKFRGMHYGKVLSPAQCYEWIVSGCWRYQKRVITETLVPPPGFFLAHESVSTSTWEEIRTWLQLDLTDPHLGLNLNNLPDNSEVIPWEVSTQAQNRPVAQFGIRYDYAQDKVVTESSATRPIPDILKRLLLDQAWSSDPSSGLPAPEHFTQCIINVYGANTTSHIPWHKDDPAFGNVICVYTFGESRPLKLRRMDMNRYTHYTAQPRHLSRYVLSGDARELWEHSVPTGCGWRISITFRSMRPVGVQTVP